MKSVCFLLLFEDLAVGLVYLNMHAASVPAEQVLLLLLLLEEMTLFQDGAIEYGRRFSSFSLLFIVISQYFCNIYECFNSI